MHINYKRDYNVISKFKCNGKDYVTVRIGRGVHVMEHCELKRLYGILHPERWRKAA